MRINGALAPAKPRDTPGYLLNRHHGACRPLVPQRLRTVHLAPASSPSPKCFGTPPCEGLGSPLPCLPQVSCPEAKASQESNKKLLPVHRSSWYFLANSSR